MLDWMVDHATTFYWLLGIVALIFFIAWYLTPRPKYLGIAGTALGVMALLFLLTRLIVTDRHQITANIWEMRGAVLNGQADTLTKHLAKDFQYGGMPGDQAGKALVQVARAHQVNDIHLWDFQVEELDRTKGQAKMDFKVRVGGGGDTWGLVQAKSTFVLEGGKWKLRDITFHQVVGKNMQPIDIPLK